MAAKDIVLPSFFDYPYETINPLRSRRTEQEYPFFDHLIPDEVTYDRLVEEQYLQLLQEGKTEGFTPVIVIADETLIGFFALTLAEYKCATLSELAPLFIQESKQIDGKKLLEKRLPKEHLTSHPDIIGSFSGVEANHHLLTLLDNPHFLKESLVIAKIPTLNYSEIPAYLPMGGFNYCPTPAEQIAIFNEWITPYDARPALITADSWELAVGNPPITEEEAEKLAIMQIQFSEDLLLQGTGDLRTLASTLIDSSYWYFWWD